MSRDISRQNATLPAQSPALSVHQAKALAALLSGATVTSAAEKAGVTRQTVHRWLAENPEFIAEYNLARKEMSDSVEQALRLLSAQAVNVVKRTLTHPKVSTALKLRAAIEVLKITSEMPVGSASAEDIGIEIATKNKHRFVAGILAQ